MTVIWLSGPPGAGKTSVAQRLVAIGAAKLVDPELIGQQLLTSEPGVDYQDLPEWRQRTVRDVSRQASRANVVVPMSLVDSAARSEIFSTLRAQGVVVVEFFLQAGLDTCVRRIRNRGGSAMIWCLENLARLSITPSGAVVVDSGDPSVEAIADEVMARTREALYTHKFDRTVLVDMDGVLADFDIAVIKHLRATLASFAELPTRANCRIVHDYPEYRWAIDQLVHGEGFFAGLPMVQNAVSGLERMMAAGFDVRICTSPLLTSEYSEVEKQAWVRSNLVPWLGSAILDDMLILSNKSDAQGCALIDDRPSVKYSTLANWRHLVFDRDYNRISTSRRVRGWDDPTLIESVTAASKAAIARGDAIASTD